MSTELIAYADIDAVLGHRDGRFFGEGYKRITHRVFDIALDRDAQDRPRLTATAGVDYPLDWSRKSTRVLVPHVSSIDCAIFGYRLLEVILRECYGLTDSEIRSCWVPFVQFSSGTIATESLAEFSVSATVVAVEGKTISITGALGGGMSLEATVALPVTPPAGRAERRIVRETGRGYFHSGVYTRAQYLSNVVVSDGHSRARADFALAEPDPAGPWHGVADAYQPSVTLVDATVILAQLSQVVLYELDNIARKDSETLWMRRMTARASAPPAPFTAGSATTHMVRSMVLAFGGGDWRISSWASDFAGCEIRYDLAHRLPA
ncbi:AvrD family protein [Nocardia barduliensis]|uniref:AvrD family protein n=1 Tax=Nocardia barduliensis TaxID=2736643 RepID=UPI001574752C|nr:AvrD family protein [Nocardia barduliensis]